jgi:hypothetical protein
MLAPSLRTHLHPLPPLHRIYKGRYGGYAGEAAPEKVYELLSQDDNIFLVDIRPEETREKEGLPQLKLGARFKVAAFPLQVRWAVIRVQVQQWRGIAGTVAAAVAARTACVVAVVAANAVVQTSSCTAAGGARHWGGCGLRLRICTYSQHHLRCCCCHCFGCCSSANCLVAVWQAKDSGLHENVWTQLCALPTLRADLCAAACASVCAVCRPASHLGWPVRL